MTPPILPRATTLFFALCLALPAAAQDAIDDSAGDPEDGELFVSLQLSELLETDPDSGFVYGVDAVLSDTDGYVVGVIETHTLLTTRDMKHEPSRIEVNPEVLLHGRVFAEGEPSRIEVNPEVLLNSHSFGIDGNDLPTRYEVDPEVLLNARAHNHDSNDEPTRYEVDNEVLLNSLADGKDEPTRYEVDNEVLLNSSP